MRKHSVTAALLAAVTTLLLSQPFSPAAEAATCSGDPKALPDFDGSGGVQPDIAIGVPGEDLGTQADAGLVEIRYANDTRTPQGLSGSAYRAGDRFGTAILAPDFDGDGCSDLLVGAPGRDVAGLKDAGVVEVYQGSPTGLRWYQTITMNPAQAGVQFGGVLSAYSRRGLYAAGLPLYDVGGAKDAGAVLDFDLQTGKFEGPWTQDAAWIPGVAEAGDHFGAQLNSTSTFEGTSRYFESSAPLEDGSGAKDVGVVIRCWGVGSVSHRCVGISQNSPGIPGSAEAGDRFGEALSPGYIGVPGEDIGSIRDAGMVISHQRHGISQDTGGVPGTPGEGDRFGAALISYSPPVVNDFFSDVVFIGAPGEDVGGRADAGTVAIVFQSLEITDDVPEPFGIGGLTADVTAGTVDEGDRYGAVLGMYAVLAGRYGRSPLLQIGSPGAESGAGEVFSVAPDNPSRSKVWRQVAGVPEAGDGYGLALL